MRRRQHFGEPVKRKSKHTLLSGQTRVAGKWLKGIIKEHFIGNKGDASLPAHRHDTFPLGRLDIGSGRIIRINQYQCTNTSAARSVKQLLQLGHVNEPRAVEPQLVFDGIHAFKPGDRLDQRVSRLGGQHCISGIT